MNKRILACILCGTPAIAFASGFSDAARSEASKMPAPAYCTDSFMAQIHYDDFNSSSEWVEILDRIDTNNDQRISIEEAMMSSVVTELFAQIDTDQDRALRQDEVLRFTADMILGEYIEIFRQADLDKDGFFSLPEVSRVAGLDGTNFKSIDMIQDGQISFHEYMVWRESVDGVYLRSAFSKLGMVAS